MRCKASNCGRYASVRAAGSWPMRPAIAAAARSWSGCPTPADKANERVDRAYAFGQGVLLRLLVWERSRETCRRRWISPSPPFVDRSRRRTTRVPHRRSRWAGAVPAAPGSARYVGAEHRHQGARLVAVRFPGGTSQAGQGWLEYWLSCAGVPVGERTPCRVTMIDQLQLAGVREFRSSRHEAEGEQTEQEPITVSYLEINEFRRRGFPPLCHQWRRHRHTVRAAQGTKSPVFAPGGCFRDADGADGLVRADPHRHPLLRRRR